MPPSSKSTICNARSRLIALRALAGFDAWKTFLRANRLDYASWYRFVRGSRDVNADFVERAARALGTTSPKLRALVAAVIAAESEARP